MQNMAKANMKRFQITRLRLLPLLLLGALLAAGLPAKAQNASPNLGDFKTSGIDGADKGSEAARLLGKIEAYLNGIDTITARYAQLASNGAYAEGMLHLDRPGKMRFEYDAPHPIVMISDGDVLFYYDRDLEEATRIDVEQTPIWFLLREQVSFDQPLRIVELKRRGGTVLVSLVEEDKLDQGTVTLQFNENPLSLQRWQIVDAQGMIIQITLLDPRFNDPIPDKAFDFSEYTLPLSGSASDR
jgi:outer membrane lipoprotein-sorting protein